MEIQEKKIGIIGCGWLGLPLGAHLVNKGYHVNGSTTTVGKFTRIRKEGINPYRINLASIDKKAITSFLAIDTLIIAVPPSNQQKDLKAQLVALRDFILAETRHIQIIFVSSTSVYPNTNKEVSEEDAAYIETPRSKAILLELEEVFTKSRLNTVVIRFGGLFGPDREPGRFLRNKTEVSGGTNPVNMIHLDDCIGVIDFMIQHKVLSGIYNACSPLHPDKKTFYTAASLKLGHQPPAFSEDQRDFKLVSSQKLIELGYSFKYQTPLEAL